MKKISTKIIIFISSIFLISFGYFNFNNNQPVYKISNIDFSDFVKEADKGNISDVTISGLKIVGHLSDGSWFKTVAPFQDKDLVNRLIKNNIHIKVNLPEDASFSIVNLIVSWLPMILILIVWLFYLKQLGKGASKALSFGKMNSKKTTEKKKVTFDDVAGADEAKESLKEIVDFLKNPDDYEKLGARIPKGVLLFGPPGTGKTLLARAVAGEADCAFFSVSGSDFVEMFVGVGASRVRNLFDQAKKQLPAIIFIDEIDAVGRHRGVGLGGGNDEREQTLNAILTEIDGFVQNKGLIIFGATNRPDVLDPALTRSGRFDRQVTVGLPDLKQRLEILKVHVKKIKINPELNLESVAKSTVGFSGADLENLLNESALSAARLKQSEVILSNIEEAKDRILMGAEKRTLSMQEKEKKLTAYHESGHAIIAFYAKNTDPIHKMTIVPRGRALGMVVQLPEFDKVSMTKAELIDRIRILMAGRVAEELIFGKEFVTSGASNDIKVATDIAKRMVLEFGMSDVCGMMNYQDANEIQFGKVSSVNHHSQEFAKILDLEIKKIIDVCYEYSFDFLKDNIKKLETLTEELLKSETLTGQEIKNILEPDLV